MSSLPLRNPYFRDFWKAKARYRFLYGGRASGKSYELAAQLVFLSSKYKLKILATRYFQNKIADSIYALLIGIIDTWNYRQHFTITNTSIICKATGSEFIFSGLFGKVDELKSIEGIDILIIDEAHSMTAEIWEVLIPTIRKQGSEIWCAFNPRSRLDFSWKKFVENPPENSVVMKVNYDSNIYLSDTMQKVINEMKEEDKESYDHIYEGYPTEGSENSLFKYKDIERAMHRKVQAAGAVILGVDVGRTSDPSAICIRKGLKVFPIQERKKDGEETASWAVATNNAYKADAVIIDTVGAGGTTYDIVKKIVNFAVDGNNSKAASNTDRFKNKRAESYWLLAEDIRQGLIELPNDDILAEELLATEYFFNTAGQIQIVDKDKVIKVAIGRSPNKADALALTYFIPISAAVTSEVEEYDTISNIY